MARVKEKSSRLQKAVERGDDYVAGQLTGVLKDMRNILKNGEDERSRVGAGKALMDWAKPKKGMTFGVQVNNPVQVNSQLGLPSAPPTFQEARMLREANEEPPRPVQKVLPEAPRTAASSKRPFLSRELEPAGPSLPEPLPVRRANEREPDKPAPASSVKPYDR